MFVRIGLSMVALAIVVGPCFILDGVMSICTLGTGVAPCTLGAGIATCKFEFD
jgi:hypothetical protein